MNIKLWFRNRKLPAWIGSILFHAALVVCLLLWFSLSPSPKSAPVERTAVGEIILSSNSDSNRQSEQAAEESQNTNARVLESFTERFSDIKIDILPTIPTIAPGQTISNTTMPSAESLTNSLQNGLQSNGGFNGQKGETTVLLFGTEGKGTKFMYVFDRSASMAGSPIRAAKIELAESLKSFNEFHQFNILFYSGKDEWILWRKGRKLVYATPTEKENAVRFVAEIMPDGGTRHFEPLKEAIMHRPDVIFFLTDGERGDDLTPVELSEIERFNSRGIQINVIQFGRGGLTDSASQSLRQLAEQNHGQYQYVNVTALR